MVFNPMQLFGIVGLVLITTGVVLKRRQTQDWFYIFGGSCLLVYSIFLGDMIFISLQVIFIIAAIIDLVKLVRTK